MDELEVTIMQMRKLLQEREEELRKAGTFGKQLLEDRQILASRLEDTQSKLEILEQEKYSLQTDLKIQIQTRESHSMELENERKQLDNLYKQLQIFQQENQSMQQRMQNIMKENQELKKSQEDLECDVSLLKAKAISQDEQIKVFRDQPGISLNDSSFDATSHLENELSSHILKIKNLEHELSETQHELHDTKMKESQLNKLVQELKQEVEDKDAEIKSYSIEMKKVKEEVADLLTEIESHKLEQVDINRRGNSVFSELDDRRKFVEKEYKVLDKKFQNLMKVYEENKKELLRARGQIAILSSMTSRDYQQKYIEKLEDDNLSGREEIRNLTVRLSKMMKNQELYRNDPMKFKNDEYDYLRALLQQAEEKVESLKNEVISLHMQNIDTNDKLSESRHYLYQVNQELDKIKKENEMLKLKVQDAQSNQNAICSNCIASMNKPIIQILPGRESPAKRTEILETTIAAFDKKSAILDKKDVIPAEFELGEDGFKMKKPPRKSNISVLREFNRLSNEEDKETKKPSEKAEFVAETKNPIAHTIKKLEAKEPSSSHKFNLYSGSASRNKMYSAKENLKNDRCAQQ